MDYSAELLRRYPYLTEEADRLAIINKAKFFFYSILYKADMSVDETSNPITGFRHQQWILAVCDDIINREGISNVKAYSENGLNKTFDNTELSLALISMLVPIAGVMK